MAELYPLKFTPILKERVWGGSALQKDYGKSAPADKKIGESWELSGLQGDLSVISNGYLAGNNIEEISEVYMGDLLGDSVYQKFGREFPLLIKLIDARDRLSLQVHPDDKTAKERHNAYGKTEMWYVLESEKDAFIKAGFSSQCEKNDFFQAIDDNRLEQLMNTVNPRSGDVFYIPAGRVHTLGNGVVLAEIQQCSDITYRIHDWNRTGLDGGPRELHRELAEDVIDCSVATDHHRYVTPERNRETELISCPYFTSNIIKLDSEMERDYSMLDSFVILIGINGEAEIEYCDEKTTINKGETVLIPAIIENLILISEGASLIEVYIDNSNNNKEE